MFSKFAFNRYVGGLLALHWQCLNLDSFHVTESDSIREVHGPLWLGAGYQHRPQRCTCALYRILSGKPSSLGPFPVCGGGQGCVHLCVLLSCQPRALWAFMEGLDEWQIRRELKRAVKATKREVRHHS